MDECVDECVCACVFVCACVCVCMFECVYACVFECVYVCPSSVRESHLHLHPVPSTYDDEVVRVVHDASPRLRVKQSYTGTDAHGHTHKDMLIEHAWVNCSTDPSWQR